MEELGDRGSGDMVFEEDIKGRKKRLNKGDKK